MESQSAVLNGSGELWQQRLSQKACAVLPC